MSMSMSMSMGMGMGSRKGGSSSSCCRSSLNLLASTRVARPALLPVAPFPFEPSSEGAMLLARPADAAVLLRDECAGDFGGEALGGVGLA